MGMRNTTCTNETIEAAFYEYGDAMEANDALLKSGIEQHEIDLWVYLNIK